MQLRFIQGFFVCSVLSLLLSCATSKKGVGGLSADFTGGQTVLFGYKMLGTNGAAPPSDCTIQFETLAKPTRSFDFQLPVNEDYFYAQLEPRQYRVSRIKCGYAIYRVSNLFGLKEGLFQVHPGRVNYIGFSSFVFTQTQDLSFQWGQKVSLEFLQSVYPTMSKSVAARLTNGYTGKLITERQVKETKINQFFNARYAAGDRAQIAAIQSSTNRIKAEVTRCFREEEAINPLRIGVLKYEIAYKAKRFHKAKQEVFSSYTDRLTNCLARAFKVFKPSTASELEYILEL